ncbi:hypothetical protein C8R45DRAFT_948512 [Mycena sanguinolenta]|nr:hypothetical protein C8R45DRAFT_948512 [Mycena sanguinolenta]
MDCSQLLKNLIYLNNKNDWVTTPDLQAVGLSVNTELHLFICCESALTAVNYIQHFSRAQTHKGVKLGQCVTKAVAHFQIANHYPSLAGSRTARPIISGLPSKDKQFGCPECGYAAHRKTVATHMTKDHPGSRLAIEEGLVTQVLNDGTAKTKSCIRVKPATEADITSADPSGLLVQIKAFELVQDYQVPNARMVSPWLMGTLWHKEIEKHQDHIQDLCDLVSMPKDDEFPKLRDCVKEYFYQATSLIDDTELLVLRKLNTHDIDAGMINHTPLHEHHQGNKTLDQYLVPLLHLLAALMRSSPHYTLPTSPELDEALDEFESMSTSSLHKVLMALWKTFWRSSKDAKAADPTMKFLCLFRLKSDGSFHTAKDTTRPITQLCRGIQLAILTEIHALVDSNVATNQMEAWDMVVPFVKNNELTSFASLTSLQHLATNLSMSTMSMPQINWLDRKKWHNLQYLGNPISLEQLQTMVGNLEDEIVTLWEGKVLLGLGLHIEYGDLADNLVNATPGYSFLKDPRNPFADHKHTLVEHIFSDAALVKRFVVCAPGSDVAQLNVMEARKWLSDLAALEALVMVAAEESNGGVTRGTELTSMLAENTEFRNRNLAGLGKYVAMIRQYDKTTNNAQSDKVIPLALSAFLADILIQIHTLARPFAQYLSSVIWPTDTKLQQDYSSMLFMDMGRQFTSDKVSAVMGQKSLDVLDWKMTLQPHRHINIAFRRMHCSSSLDSEDATTAANAMSNGHSLQTENRIYGISPDALVGAAEDVFQVYLQTSTHWQRKIRVVPGGMGLSYKEAHHKHFDKLVPSDNEAGEDDSIQSELKTMLKQQQTLLRQMFEISERLETKVETLEQNVVHLTDVVKGTNYKVNSRDRLASRYQPGEDDEFSITSILSSRPGSPMMVEPGSDETVVAAAEQVAVAAVAEQVIVRKRPADKPVSTRAPLPNVPTPPVVQRQTPADKPVTTKAPLPKVHSSAAIRPTVARKTKGPETDVLDALRKIYGPDATWKSHQQYQAVKALLDLDSDVIVTLPTGAGKTLLAVLCALVENGYTVVILPLIALIEDWERRLKGLGIPYERFKNGQDELRGDANLILVTSDMAKSPSWAKAIAMLNQTRPVLRQVVDEGHYYATDHGFRPQALDNAFQLRQFPTQIAIFTATAPEPIRNYLIDQFELSNPVHIKGSIHRAELTMEIHTTANSFISQVDLAKRIIAEEMESKAFRSSNENRYLIFVTSLAEGKVAADKLGLPLYHANSAENPISDQDRWEMYDNWLKGVFLGMVCTNAMGGGNDYAHVRFSIHLGQPFDMILFNQQKGRTARDEEPGTNYVIAPSRPFTSGKSKNHPIYGDMTGRKAVQDLLFKRDLEYPSSCYYYQETKFFDGHGQTCTDLGRASLCAPCLQGNHLPLDSEFSTPQENLAMSMIQPAIEVETLKRKRDEAFGPSTERARKRAANIVQDKMGNISGFRDLLTRLGNVCGYCIVCKVPNPGQHNYKECPNIDESVRSDFGMMKSAIDYQGASRPCFRCHIASSGQDALHPAFVTGKVTCEYPNLVLGLAFGVRRDKVLREAAEKEFKVPSDGWDTFRDFGSWFSQAHPTDKWRSMAFLRWYAQLK